MVSIIIPCYNVEDTLPFTIESILKQTDSNWEILAVNDGSTDMTAEVIKKYANNNPKIKLYSKKNGGVSSARNLGLKYAKGDWIYFLDADDLIDSYLIETINNQPNDTDVMIFEFIMESNDHYRHYKLTNPSTLFRDYLTNKQTIHISSLATRRNFIEKHPISFDEQTHYGEDREFIAKLFTFKPSYICLNKILFKYQVREGSAMTSRNYNSRKFSSILASERTYKSLINTSEERSALAVLAFTIVRHLKMYNEFKIKDTELYPKLKEYVQKYVQGLHFYGFGHIEFYTTVAGILAYNNKLLKLFLHLY
ncbi:MAG: glycosyltransferase family 2 protein [Bacteroides sp.]|nr:glycosyltransferase family 2 protein [Bacteroides sp.]